MKISATIITLNEEKNIGDCLASLGFADEIIVVDSGSTDRTVEICKAHPKVRLFEWEWLGFGRQKNLAAESAINDWIFNIDADERVSPALRESITSAPFTNFSAFRVARENYFGRKRIRHCGWYPDYNTRLYDRKTCRFSDRAVHETLLCEGSVGTLSGNLVHFTYEGIGDYLKRMDRYSTLAAEEIVKSGRKSGIIGLVFRPFFTFLKMYVLKKGFREGYVGFLLSLLYSMYTFVKYAKALELSHDSSCGRDGNQKARDDIHG